MRETAIRWIGAFLFLILLLGVPKSLAAVAGSPTIALTVTPTTGIASTNPLMIQAETGAVGTWQAAVHQLEGQTVAALPSFVGASYTATWFPSPEYQVPGAHFVWVQWSTADSTLSATAPFQTNNFPAQITTLSFLNGAWQPIQNPKAGQPFYIQVRLFNHSAESFPSVLASVTVDGTFLGAGGITLNPQSEGSVIIPAQLPAGTYPLRTFAWTGPGGTPLTADLRSELVVLP